MLLIFKGRQKQSFDLKFVSSRSSRAQVRSAGPTAGSGGLSGSWTEGGA